MISKEECLFTKYVREIVDNDNFEGSSISYGTLLRKCNCNNCRKEKEEKNVNKKS